MNLEFPVPYKGMALTHMLIVSDVDRSRNFYRYVLGADVLRERNPCMLRLYNGWLILNVGGGPTQGVDVSYDAAPAAPGLYILGFARQGAANAV